MKGHRLTSLILPPTTRRMGTPSFSSVLEARGIISQEALQFLDRSSNAKYNLSAAGTLPFELAHPPSSFSNIFQKLLEAGYQREVQGVSRGTPETLNAVQGFFKRRQINCKGDNIAVAQDILSSMERMAKAKKFRETVLLVAPTFGYYRTLFEALDLKVKVVTTKETKTAEIDLTSLEEIIRHDRDIGGVLICNPTTPTGMEFSEKTAEEVYNITCHYNVNLFTDEAFADPRKHNFNFARIASQNDYSGYLSLISFKKSLPSTSHAICLGDEKLVSSFLRIGGPPEISDATVCMIASDNKEIADYLEKCEKIYRQNIALVNSKLQELNQKFRALFGEERDFVKLVNDNPDIPSTCNLDCHELYGKKFVEDNGNEIELKTGLDIAKWFYSASVATVPGELYGIDESAMLVRISLNTSPKQLEKAFDSIIEVADKIKTPSPSISARDEILPAHNTTTKDSGR